MYSNGTASRPASSRRFCQPSRRLHHRCRANPAEGRSDRDVPAQGEKPALGDDNWSSSAGPTGGTQSTPAAAQSPSLRVEKYSKVSNGTYEAKRKRVDELKRQLLMATAGLDRGLSATKRQASDVQRVARSLEEAGGDVQLSWLAGGKVRSGMDDLDGVWRLIYSSAFESGNLGGSRPGPQASLVPFSLVSSVGAVQPENALDNLLASCQTQGPVYQRVNAQAGVLDNIVELLFAKPPVPVPFAVDDPTLRATLRHTFAVSNERSVRIVYESTFADLLSGEEPVQLFGRNVQLEPPAVQRLLPEDFRSASFDVTFLDDTVRVTRGDRSELRIYWKDRDALGDVFDPDTNNTFSSMG